MPTPSSRLRPSRALRVLLVVGLLLVAWRGCGGGGAAAPSLTGTAYSCQLHVHGPFSEGVGSIDSHSFEGAQHGLDVLWWSDHDFRATSYNHVGRYGFEELFEPQARGEDWSLVLDRREGDTKGVRPLTQVPGAGAELVEAPVREGQRALRLSVPGATPRFRPFVWTFETRRLLHRRALATGVTVRLAVFPEELGPDARVSVRVDLSEHAPREGLALEPYALEYELTTDASTEERRVGAVFHVPVPVEPGRWNELVLEVTADAGSGFPFLPGPPGEDNALFGLSLGVEARRGARATAVFDDLRIDQELAGPPAFAHQRELLRALEPAYPGLTQLQGVEISYAARHLNEFSLDTGLLDYDALAREAGYERDRPELLDDARFKALIVERAVADAHARGGLISWNHLYGVNPAGAERGKTPERMLEILLEARAFGVDLLEVGYRDRAGASLGDHLEVWDRSALAGLRLVGLGVSDAHGGPDDRWDVNPNNFVTWIYAGAPTKPELIEGLRAGRAFFGDLTRFDGLLDLVTDARHRMGSEVVTDRDAVDVTLLGRGLPADATVHVVVAGERVASFRDPGEAGEHLGRHRVPVPADGSTLVRFEVHTPDAGAVALTNPVHLLRAVPPGGLEPARAAFDVRGIRSEEVAGVRILALDVDPEGDLELRFEAENGRLVVTGADPAVRIRSGSFEVGRDGPRVTLSRVRGSGTIVLRPR